MCETYETDEILATRKLAALEDLISDITLDEAPAYTDISQVICMQLQGGVKRWSSMQAGQAVDIMLSCGQPKPPWCLPSLSS